MPRSRPTGWSRHSCGSPRSYIAWPVSCSAPSRPGNTSSGSKRVVTRMSPGTPSVNGCSLSSSRPRSNGKPTAFMTSTTSARCLPAGNLPVSGSSGRLSCTRDRLADQRRQPARERLEHGVDVGRGEAGAELIHQRIVGREIQRLAEQRRLVAHQVDDLLEMRREHLELALPRAPRASAIRRARPPCVSRETSVTGVAIA